MSTITKDRGASTAWAARPGGQGLATFRPAGPGRFEMTVDAGGPERPAAVVRETGSMVDLMMRAAELRLAATRVPAAREARTTGPVTLLVCRTDRSGTREQQAARLAHQLEVAACGSVMADGAAGHVGGALRAPHEYGARRVRVVGGDGLLFPLPGTDSRVLVLAGTCPGGPGWTSAVTGTVRDRRPGRLLVSSVSRLGTDRDGLAALLLQAPEVLVGGVPLRAVVSAGPVPRPSLRPAAPAGAGRAPRGRTDRPLRSRRPAPALSGRPA